MKNILILQKKGLKRMSHIKVRIEDKETGLMSEGIDVMNFINNEDINFEFPDETVLPYNDFIFFRNDYEVYLEEE